MATKEWRPGTEPEGAKTTANQVVDLRIPYPDIDFCSSVVAIHSAMYGEITAMNVPLSTRDKYY